MHLDCHSAINFIAQDTDVSVENRQLFFKGFSVICAGLRNEGNKIFLVTKIDHCTIQLFQSTIANSTWKQVGSLLSEETNIGERYEECELSYYIGRKKNKYLSVGIATNPALSEIKNQLGKDFIIYTNSKISFFSSRVTPSMKSETEELQHHSLSLAKIIAAKNGQSFQ